MRKKVSIHLNYEGFLALSLLLQHKIVEYANMRPVTQPVGSKARQDVSITFYHKLHASVMMDLHVRTQKKVIALVYSSRTKMRAFTLKDTEAYALFNVFGIQADVDTYERQLLNYVCSEIHKQLI